MAKEKKGMNTGGNEAAEDFRYFDDLPCGVVVFELEKGRNLIPLYRNAWYRRLFGYVSPRQAALKDNALARFYGEDRKRVTAMLMASAAGQAGEMTARLTFENQNVIRVHLRIWCLERDYIQPKIGMVITGADNEDQVDPMAATRNQFYRHIAQNVAPVVYDYDIEQDRFFYIEHTPEGKICENTIDHYLEELRNERRVHPSTVREYRKALAGDSEEDSVDFLGLGANGEYEWRRAELRKVHVSDRDSLSLHMIGTIAPVSSGGGAKQRPVHMDRVTGLQDRDSTMTTIQWILEARDTSARAFALFRLNGLSDVDDAMGDRVGDRLLHRLGQVLAHALQGQDVIGRYSGSVFVVFIRHANSRKVAESLWQDAQAAMAEEAGAHPEYPRIGVTAGIAYLPEDGGTLAEAEAAAANRLEAATSDWENQG